MRQIRRFAPATPWRAFFVVFGLSVISLRAGPPASSAPPPLAQVGKPSAVEAAKILRQFQHSGWFGYVEFELHALPRRGDETVFRGRLWGGRDDDGAVTRIEVTDATGVVHRFLLQNGDHASVWHMENGRVALVTGAALLAPLVPGVEITAFDLQMPYLYWPDVTVGQVARVRGRPAYEFIFHPPMDFAQQHPDIGAIRTYFDAQFSAPIETELDDPRRLVKTMSLVDLKRVGDQWIPKSFDVRNEITRDKTRFEVTAVALNIDFGPAAFAPPTLAENLAPPASDRIVRFDR